MQTKTAIVESAFHQLSCAPSFESSRCSFWPWLSRALNPAAKGDIQDIPAAIRVETRSVTVRSPDFDSLPNIPSAPE